MRYRLMATYLGVPYHAGLGPDGADVTLFSPGPPPEELGFTAAPGHWRKQVSVTDLSALWQSRLVGEYRGEPCLVLDDLGERLHIVYLGRDAVRARQLGYWEIDREVFEVVVARTDVDGLTEERVEFPLSAAMFPPSNPAPPPEAGPLFDVFRPVGGNPPPSPEPEPEPETLIQSRLDAQGRVMPRDSAESPRPRTRMEPIPPTRTPAPPGYPGQDRGPRTTDRAAAWHGSPAPGPWSREDPRPGPWAGRDPGPGPGPGPGPEPGPARAQPQAPPPGQAQAVPPGRRTARKDRVSPQSVFAELLSLAGIPQATYAVDEEVPGAMCLVKAEGGFEVFSCTDDARLEVHFFEGEEAAYFYLFGVLAAEAIRSRRLGPTRPNGYINGTRGPAGAADARAARENVSKYLRDRKLAKSQSRPAIVELPAGLTVPRSPSSLVGLFNHRSTNGINGSLCDPLSFQANNFTSFT
jgi:hypothetical protein